MEVMNVVAIVGAAAWTPQIITWIYRFFTKPQLSIYLHTQPQIGYSSFGPIFNVSCALLSKNKDAIINKFTATLKHESGALYEFDWVGLSEVLSEIENPMGPLMSIKKPSLPLVIKVLHTGVFQAFVRFQHGQFRVSMNKPFASLLERFNILKNSGKLISESDIDGLKSETEFDRVLKLIDSEFIWHAGEYTVTFELHSPNKIKYKKDEYVFTLSQEDIENLKENIENIKFDIFQRAKQEIVKDYKPKDISWVWKNPELRKKKHIQLTSTNNQEN